MTKGVKNPNPIFVHFWGAHVILMNKELLHTLQIKEREKVLQREEYSFSYFLESATHAMSGAVALVFAAGRLLFAHPLLHLFD